MVILLDDGALVSKHVADTHQVYIVDTVHLVGAKKGV
jgi:hypothetical protein